VTYSVTDSDGNKTIAKGVVLVNDGTWVTGADWAIHAQDFLTIPDDVNAASNVNTVTPTSTVNELILRLSEAVAFQVRDGAIVAADPVVKAADNFSATPGKYPITIGIDGAAAGASSPTRGIIGTVLSREAISNTPSPGEKVPDINTHNPDDKAHYVVVADNVNLSWNEAGELAGKTDLMSKTRLIQLAAAEAFQITNQAPSITTVKADVSANSIQQASGPYDVSFIPAGVGGVTVTVKFNVQEDPAPPPVARYCVTFNANGGWLTGPAAIYVQPPTTTIPYLPSTPTRSGYRFLFWSTARDGGSEFTASTPVTADITVYAQWEKNTEPPVPPIQPPTVIIKPPIIKPPVIYPPTITITPPPVTVQPPVNPVPNPGGGNPGTSPGTGTTEPPTVTPEITDTPSWSLFDLLVVILTGLLLIACFVKFVVDRRMNNDWAYPGVLIDINQWASMTPEQRAEVLIAYDTERRAFEREKAILAEDSVSQASPVAQADPAVQTGRAAEKSKLFHLNPLVLLIMLAVSLGSLVALLLTQDFRGAMTFWDKFSWLFALLFFIALIIPAFAAILRNASSKDKNPDDEDSKENSNKDDEDEGGDDNPTNSPSSSGTA
jgi:uncharacterized repeat protein (TIGR02543 family)